MNIKEYLKTPFLMPHSTETTKSIFYVYADAITHCDCGKQLVLTQRAWGSPLYTGSCSCGLKWELCYGKIKTIKQKKK